MTRSVILSLTAVLLAAPAFGGISLGTAETFAVLGASTVTNTGATQIRGNLGVSPGTAITGFPPGIVEVGTIHDGDAVAMQAQADLNTAYNAFAGLPCKFNLTGQDLGGLTLTPGVYCFDSSAQLTGTLVLDFQGSTTAHFVFQIGSTLTTASSSMVSLANCTKHCEIFWQVGSSATLGTTSKFSGNIMAKASITITTNVVICGRALAETGAVTMDTDMVFFMGSLTPPVSAEATVNSSGVVQETSPAESPVTESGSTILSVAAEPRWKGIQFPRS
jgi:hypothetical protein